MGPRSAPAQAAAAGTSAGPLIDWHLVKEVLAHVSGISKDAWHVVLGVVLLLTFARLTARGVADRLPWALILVVELANEFYDLTYERWPTRAVQWGESAKDLLLTLALPTLLLLVARRAPHLLARRPVRDDAG